MTLNPGTSLTCVTLNPGTSRDKAVCLERLGADQTFRRDFTAGGLLVLEMDCSNLTNVESTDYQVTIK